MIFFNGSNGSGVVPGGFSPQPYLTGIRYDLEVSRGFCTKSDKLRPPNRQPDIGPFDSQTSPPLATMELPHGTMNF